MRLLKCISFGLLGTPLFLWGQEAASLDGAVFSEKFSKPIACTRELIRQRMAEESIPGLSAAVSVNGQIIWAQGFGYADLENKVPVTVATRFRIGSISKSMTGIILLRLEQNGLLELDSPVARYVPAWPKNKPPVTFRQLAGHTAGIRHYNMQSLEFLSRQHFYSVNESLRQFKADSLLFTPGTQFHYSSFGYVLLSAALEGVSGIDYLQLMRDSLFLPMGLKNTGPDYTDSLVAGRASFYDHGKSGWVNSYYVDLSGKWAAGGFLSTAADLVQMASAVQWDHFLSDSSRATLFASQRLPDGSATGYGIGWRTGTDGRGRMIFHHGGQSVGGRAFLVVYPEEKMVIAIAANISANFKETFTEKIADCFTGSR